MTGAVLAGGEGRRFPYPKGLMRLGGERAVDCAIRALGRVFRRVVLSTNEPEVYSYLGVPMIGDLLAERGPMTGILSVLCAEGGDVFFTACDMPFLNPGVVRLVSESHREGRDATVALFGGRPEPLFGVYSSRLLGRMERDITGGKKGLRRFLEKADVLCVEEEDIRTIDPEGRSFVNINTVEELEKENALCGRRSLPGA